MATPKEGYYVDGKRVPGTTTIINSFKESGGLVYWAWNIPFVALGEARALLADALDGRLLLEQSRDFLKRPLDEWNYKTHRDQAADAGTIAHEMMDCKIHGRQFDSSQYDPALVARALPAYYAFMNWAAQAKFEIVETEISLTSRQHLFGGTRDAILIDGKRALGDWKTSNGVYADYLLQLGAYGILDEEAGNKIEGGYHLLRFSKQEKPDDPVHFAHHFWSQLDRAKEAFLLERKLYDIMKDLKKLAK
jgi:hypothetical protein